MLLVLPRASFGPTRMKGASFNTLFTEKRGPVCSTQVTIGIFGWFLFDLAFWVCLFVFFFFLTFDTKHSLFFY